ncbi:diguanylate cyclase [Photobacterium leiognathi]|uniref:diguanylate cyclase n=1 Tax=Photobacterium leiognathi TaxID=553611 RepID=UPI0034E985CC
MIGFKSINDTYGHDVGDIVIEKLARQKIRNCIRKKDIAIRWGGGSSLLYSLDLMEKQ